MPTSRPLNGYATAVALAIVGTLAMPVAAHATPVATPPSSAHITATAHHLPYAVERLGVRRASVKKFGGGTIFVPRGSAQKVLGAVVVTPGFGGTREDMQWYGEDLAAAGYVTFTIDTLDPADLPDARAKEMLAAADYLTGTSVVRRHVSATNVALLGYSMGGGGAMQAAQTRPTIKAAVALMPFDLPPTDDPKATTPAYRKLAVPTLIVTGQKDDIAGPASMGRPAYDSIPAGTPKQYLELRGAGHEAGQGTRNTTIHHAALTYLERYLSGNVAYTKSICPAPPVTRAISTSLSSCRAQR